MNQASPNVIFALAQVRKTLVEFFDICYDVIEKADSTITLIAWVEQQRNHLGQRCARNHFLDPIDHILLALLSNVTLALVTAARERNSLDDLSLFRNAVLAEFNKLARDDLAKWDSKLPGARS